MTIDIDANWKAFQRRRRYNRAIAVVVILAVAALVAAVAIRVHAMHAPKAGADSPALRSPSLPPGPGGGHLPYSLDVPAFSEEAGDRPTLASMTVHAASSGVSARQGLATAEGTSPLPGEFGPKLAKPCLSFDTQLREGGRRSTIGQALHEQGQGQRPARADQRHEAAKLPAPAGRLFRVTAYCPCKVCCGRNAKGVTASGRPAVGKLAAADWSVLPNGSRVNVPGYGVALVCDTGSAIKGYGLDLLFPTHKQALAWGVRYLEVRGE